MRVLSLLALLVAAGSVMAQDGGAPPPAATAAPTVDIDADLRAEYLHQEEMLVRFVVRNTGPEALRFADLGARPWLVRFDITYPDGRTQPWYNTPPEVDPGQTWTLPPRGQRRVVLEVPSGARLPKGDYTLTVRVKDGAHEWVLPAQAFTVAAPRPVGGRVTRDLGGERSVGHQVAWLHQAREGFDLYLHHSDGRAPTRTLGDDHLWHLDRAIEPVLTLARATERWSRYVYWQASPRRVEFVHLRGPAQGVAEEVLGRFETPYPVVELLGRGSTDAKGGLHVPLWVPAPSGPAGEVSVASVRERSGVVFRRVVKLGAAPAWMESAVDANGDLRMVLLADGHVDLYSLDSVSELPAVGKRLVRSGSAPAGTRPALARFGALPGEGDQAGGVAVLVLMQGAEAVEGHWFSLQGQPLGQTAALALTPGAVLEDAIALGRDDLALLFRTEGGQRVVVRSGKPPLSLGTEAGVLLLDGEGRLHLRSLVEGGPVKDRALDL